MTLQVGCKSIVHFSVSFSTTSFRLGIPKLRSRQDTQIRFLLDLARKAEPFSSRPVTAAGLLVDLCCDS